MKRSAEFNATVKHGVRAVQPDVVVHARRLTDCGAGPGPQVGLVVARSVGSSVQRHRVARRLRHAARSIVDQLTPSDRVVIRALPGSREAASGRLEKQLRAALTKAHLLNGAGR